METREPSLPSSMVLHGWLTITVAKQLRLEAASTGLAIARFESFIRRETGFETQIDCIWEPKRAHDIDDVVTNNLNAAHQIEFENEGCEHFVLSVWPVETELAYWRDKPPAP